MTDNSETIPTTITPETPTPSEPPQLTKIGFWGSLRAVLTYRSYSVYLVTAWILGTFGIIIDSYLMLYLRDILFDYVLIGVLIAIFMSMQLGTRFLGGYVGDNFNRKWLSVLTMLVSAIAFFFFAFATSVIELLFGCCILALSSLFASGSTSYIYENIPKEHGGLAMGIFQTSIGFGLIGLSLVTWLLGIGTPFISTIRIMFLLGGVCYIAASIVRTIYLEPTKAIQRDNHTTNRLRDFFQQNWQALRLLIVILPVFLGVLILDAFSDGLYRFVSMYYLNEALAFSIGEISLMLIVVLTISIPLSVTVGGFFDRHGSRRAILIVYSVMPIALILLLVAPIFHYWLPISIINPVISTYPILEPLFSTAFIAMAGKSINDILWGTVILTYLRKAIPRTETAKMLSIFFIVIMIAFIVTPIPAGVIYTIFGAVPVLFVTLSINILILSILIFGNIEPKPIPDQFPQSE